LREHRATGVRRRGKASFFLTGTTNLLTSQGGTIMRRIAACAPCLAVFLGALSVSAADLKLPAEFVKDCSYYIGDWATDVEVAGTLYRGTWKVQWSADRACIISYWAADTPQGPARGTRVEGWDALKKKVLVVDFGTSGSSSIERYTLASNKVSEGEMAGIDGEGKPFKATARTVQKSPDFFIWTVTRDGKAMEYRFHRIKK
jgi:hypothetical protein